MTSLLPRLRATAIAISVILLSGCAWHEINKIEKQARAESDTATRIFDSKTARPSQLVTWTEKPWVDLKPIGLSSAVSDDRNVPDCPILINRPDGVTLPELAQRITSVCGIRVSFTPDALASLSTGSSGNAATRQVSGSLPAPDDNGRVSLDAINGQNGNPSPVVSAGAMAGIKWDAQLRGLLDVAESRFGVSWRMENGGILFYRFDTRMYQLSFMNSKINSSASINSGSGTQLGSDGSSSSGEVSTEQKTAYGLSSEIFDDIRKTIAQILTPNVGRFFLSSSSGTLTVTDTPEVHNRVASFVEYENKILNRQVQLNFQILTVTQSVNHELGMDLDLVTNSLRNYGINVKGTFNGATTGAGSMGVSVLDTATGKAGKFAGSNLIVKALSEQGDVSVVTRQTRLTTNFTPVPYQLSNQQGMITSSASTATANVGVTSTMTTTTLTTGLFMTAVPSIQDNGDVQLQFAFSYDTPPKIEKFISADGNTRNDLAVYSKEAITQKFNMRSGETIMVTGADQVSNSADKQGTGSADFFGLGGGRTGATKRSTLVILITPVLMP
ncbi:PilN family type IVB pilus formation outer membrane protein [Citrobacter koseri]|uniref:PilN family type IVB pilus formation outer membrane protein n=1 Tax=Citrobacter koseri TaxID=545 RepID=UPI0023B1E682|nr:PilN family type IVB pilus formation outer membrane protein [Citrobacter koseri]